MDNKDIKILEAILFAIDTTLESVASNVTVNDAMSSSDLNVFAESPTTA